MQFTDLKIKKQLINKIAQIGVTTPTEIQRQAIPVIMSGRDVVAIAQTGTGKTLTYLLPIITNLKFSEQQHPRVLIIVPTRELVVQIADTLETIAPNMGVRVAALYGGANINKQRELVAEGLDIVVATPGRLYDLTVSGVLRLKQIQKLVLDEVDEIFDQGFIPQLTAIMDLLPEKKHNLMFSATLSDEVNIFIQENFYDPQYIEQAASGTPLEKIKQVAYPTPNFATKVDLISHLIETDPTMESILIFVRTKRLADTLYEAVETIYGESVAVIHGNKSQNYRLRSIATFQKRETKILIATDLIARGIDFKSVTHVINFDIPDEAESYMHRIGRTGRANRDGMAIAMINEVDSEYIDAVEQLMNMELPIEEIPEEVTISETMSLFDIEREVVNDQFYLPKQKKREGAGPAFHEKSEKNQKTNQGGKYRRELALKYKKPRARGSKQEFFRNKKK